MSDHQKIEEAIEILASVDMPRAQLNDRSGLCLLALLDLQPQKNWADSSNPLMGITPIMDWVKKEYDHEYAPNTRETFRRQTMHQFVEAGLVLYNPDKPDRPVNSPKAAYQVSPEFLTLAQCYGLPKWAGELKKFHLNQTSLVEKYARPRNQQKVKIKLDDSLELKLSPGEHSQLIKEIIKEFGPRFAPGSQLVYVGDTGDKYGYYDASLLAELGLNLDSHGKMPDVILYRKEKGWLYLIESVTSHGPVDSKRYLELAELFEGAYAKLVYVTALPSRNLLAKFLPVIAWETEVWVSESPSHLIHFNGDKFLGPYEE